MSGNGFAFGKPTGEARLGAMFWNGFWGPGIGGTPLPNCPPNAIKLPLFGGVVVVEPEFGLPPFGFFTNPLSLAGVDPDCPGALDDPWLLGIDPATLDVDPAPLVIDPAGELDGV